MVIFTELGDEYLLLINFWRSLLFHLVISLLTIIIVLLTSFKMPIEFGLFNIFIYYLFGRMYLVKLSNWKKEIASIMPISLIAIIGIITIYAFKRYNNNGDGLWMIMDIYLASVVPSMYMTADILFVKISSTLQYKGMSVFYLPFSIFPSLLLWLGLKTK